MGPAGKKMAEAVPRSNTEIRFIVLHYFYDRNTSATSARGKKGYAVKITDVRRELKTSHGLSQQEVMSNLNYLLSQGWVEEDKIQKSVSLPSGTVIPNTTSYYKITAAGIDKIEGPGEFTMDRFKGIKIEATGQNIITLGDGNQVNARYQELGEVLSQLREAIRTAENLDDMQKMDAVVDIDTLHAQLARSNPNREVTRNLWEGINRVASLAGLGELAARVLPHISNLLR